MDPVQPVSSDYCSGVGGDPVQPVSSDYCTGVGGDPVQPAHGGRGSDQQAVRYHSSSSPRGQLNFVSRTGDK